MTSEQQQKNKAESSPHPSMTKPTADDVEDVLDAIEDAGFEIVEYRHNNEGGKDAWVVDREDVENAVRQRLQDETN